MRSPRANKRFVIGLVLAGTLSGCGTVPTVPASEAVALQAAAIPTDVDGNGVTRSFGYHFEGHAAWQAPTFSFDAVDANLPPSADLRKTGKLSPVYDQGDLGACTAFAIGKGLRETLSLMSGASPKALSALYLYYKERELEGTVEKDSGASLKDGMKALQDAGDCPDARMPYDQKAFKSAPTPEADREAAGFRIDGSLPLRGLPELKAKLAAGQPAVFGMTIYKSFMSKQVARTGLMPMPKDHEKQDGGHAVMVVGYDDARQVLIVKNSWGPKWGDQGFFYMPYAFVTSENVDEIFVATGEPR